MLNFMKITSLQLVIIFWHSFVIYALARQFFTVLPTMKCEVFILKHSLLSVAAEVTMPLSFAIIC